MISIWIYIRIHYYYYYYINIIIVLTINKKPRIECLTEKMITEYECLFQHFFTNISKIKTNRPKLITTINGFSDYHHYYVIIIVN